MMGVSLHTAAWLNKEIVWAGALWTQDQLFLWKTLCNTKLQKKEIEQASQNLWRFRFRQAHLLMISLLSLFIHANTARYIVKMLAWWSLPAFRWSGHFRSVWSGLGWKWFVKITAVHYKVIQHWDSSYNLENNVAPNCTQIGPKFTLYIFRIWLKKKKKSNLKVVEAFNHFRWSSLSEEVVQL